MNELPKFAKPYQLEGIVTLTPKQRAIKRRELFDAQFGICACGCGRSMVWPQGQMDTATLEHVTPNKAGCRKQDADYNLQCFRWDCNMAKGSIRLENVAPQVTVIQ